MKNKKLRKIVLSAMFLALSIVLPFVTLQIDTFGKLLTPMHFPIILASIFIGPVYGLIIGFTAPLLRTLLFGMPPIQMALMMAFELAAYGFFTGFFLKLLKNINMKYIIKIYIALIIAMLLGRIVYALVAMFIIEANDFIAVFLGTFVSSSIGIVLQLILIPILAYRLKNHVPDN